MTTWYLQSHTTWLCDEKELMVKTRKCSFGAFPRAAYAGTAEPTDVSPAKPEDYEGLFIDALRKAIELSDWNLFTVFAPFQRMTKKEILEIGLQLEPSVDYSQTWTCYKGKEKACGKCGACRERKEAFAHARRRDPSL